MGRSNSGMTLIEILVVISIIGIGMVMAFPSLNIVTSASSNELIGRLAADIRLAFDEAVLQRKPHRLVFELASGKYWLEVANRDDVYIGDTKLNADPSAEEEKNEILNFEENFHQYVELSGQEFRDGNSDKSIKPFSPVVAAKERLRPPEWTKVESQEWADRTIAPKLIFKSVHAQHHAMKQSLDSVGPEGRALVYFFGRGYAEPAVIVVAERKGANDFDPDEAPFSYVVNSYEGTAEVQSGEKELEEDRF